MNERVKNLFDALDFRANKIHEVIHRLIDYGEHEIFAHHYLDEVYKEIAYYIYFVKSQDELKDIYEDFLNYKKNLANNIIYLNTKKQLNEGIKGVGEIIYNGEDYTDRIKKIFLERTYNPFNSDQSVGEHGEILIESMKNLNINFDWYFKNLEHFMNICFTYPLNLFNKIQSEFSEFENELSDFKKTIQENFLKLKNYSVRQIEYLEIDYISQLNSIYKYIFPEEYPPMGLDLLKSIISPRNSVYNKNPLSEYIKSLNFRLKAALLDKHSLLHILKRFKIFFELYRFKDIESNSESVKVRESYFQKVFEEFLFSNYYYPYSQGMLGNGRFDILLNNKDSLVMYELKQIGFDKQSTSKKDIIKKIKKAIHQLSDYIDRQAANYGIEREGFVILFTKISFILDEYKFLRDEYKLHFCIIDLSAETPSKKKPMNIKINELC